MVLTFPDYEIIAGITNNFADYEKIAGITNYFGVEFLKISFYLNLFVKMVFRQKERIQVIKYIYLLKKKKKIKTETEAGAHLVVSSITWGSQAQPLLSCKHSVYLICVVLSLICNSSKHMQSMKSGAKYLPGDIQGVSLSKTYVAQTDRKNFKQQPK